MGKHHSMVYLMNTKGVHFFLGFTEPVEYSGSPELGESLEMFLIECGFTWERVVCALCTDSPSVMVGMRNWFVEKYPFLMPVGCIVHFVSLIIKEIMLADGAKELFAKARVLVNYFKESPFWSEFLVKWRSSLPKHEREGIGALCTFCDTRFYSARNVMHGIVCNQSGLEEAVKLHREKVRKADANRVPVSKRRFVNLPEKVIEIIDDANNFRNMKDLISIIQPLVDAIGFLESDGANPSDVLPVIIDAYIQMREIVPGSFLLWTFNEALNIMNRRIKALDMDKNGNLYLLALFLHPRHRTFACSRKFRLMDISVLIVNMCVEKFGFDDRYTKEIVRCVRKYFNFQDPFFKNDSSSAMEYWTNLSCVETGDRALRDFALRVLNVGINQIICERGFSSAGHLKKKRQGNLKHSTFENMMTVREHEKKHRTFKQNHYRSKKKQIAQRAKSAQNNVVVIDDRLEKELNDIANATVTRNNENQDDDQFNAADDSLGEALKELNQRPCTSKDKELRMVLEQDYDDEGLNGGINEGRVDGMIDGEDDVLIEDKADSGPNIDDSVFDELLAAQASVDASEQWEKEAANIDDGYACIAADLPSADVLNLWFNVDKFQGRAPSSAKNGENPDWDEYHGLPATREEAKRRKCAILEDLYGADYCLTGGNENNDGDHISFGGDNDHFDIDIGNEEPQPAVQVENETGIIDENGEDDNDSAA
eukprot:Nk52_evm12s303 gene=Nk52_evmTU12s303